jgi:hypothetical protein
MTNYKLQTIIYSGTFHGLRPGVRKFAAEGDILDR